MSAERETSALPASGLAVVIALVLGIVAVKDQPLETFRPVKAEPSRDQIIDNQDAPARLDQIGGGVEVGVQHQEALMQGAGGGLGRRLGLGRSLGRSLGQDRGRGGDHERTGDQGGEGGGGTRRAAERDHRACPWAKTKGGPSVGPTALLATRRNHHAAAKSRYSTPIIEATSG